MHINIIQRSSKEELEDEINKIIRQLESFPATDRNFTKVKDIKFTSNKEGFFALIIFDDGRA